MKKIFRYIAAMLTLLFCNSALLVASFSALNKIPNSIVGKVADYAVEYVQDMVITADGSMVYVVCQINDSHPGFISYFDTATNTMLGVVQDPDGTFYWPAAMAISPNGLFAYVANEGASSTGNGSVSIVDLDVSSPTYNQVIGVVTDVNGTFCDCYDIAFTADGLRAYVVNDGDGFVDSSVSVIDVPTSTVIGTVYDNFDDEGASFYNPVAIAITPDQTRAYVVNNQSSYDNNSVSVIDIDPTSMTYNQVVDVIFSEGLFNSNSIAITPDGNFAYIANYNNSETSAGFVSVIDTNPESGTYNTVVDYITGLGFNETYNIVINAAGTYAYVLNNAAPVGPILIIDLSDNTIVGYIQDDAEYLWGVSIFALNPSSQHPNNTAYIATWSGGIAGYGQIVAANVVDPLDSNTTGVVTDNLTPVEYAYYIAFTPDSTTAYVSNYDNNTVSIVDVATNSVTGLVADPLETLAEPYQLVVSPNGLTGYVANYDGDTISIIDIASNTITDVVSDPDELLSEPRLLALTPDGSTLYASNWDNSTVAIVDTATNTVTGYVNDPLSLLSDIYVLVMAPNGKTLYAINDYYAIAIIDVASNTATGFVLDPNNMLNDDIYGMTISPDSKVGYVANYNGGIDNNGSVSVVDLTQNLVTELIFDPTGALNNPEGITISPDGTAVYVYCVNDDDYGSIVIINPQDKSVVGVIVDPLLDNNSSEDVINMVFAPNGSVMYSSGKTWIPVMAGKAPILPVVDLTGKSVVDQFLGSQDITNVLVWGNPPVGVSPAQYKIYLGATFANAQQVAIIPAVKGVPQTYVAHGLRPATTYTWYVTAVQNDGTESYPVGIKVTNK